MRAALCLLLVAALGAVAQPQSFRSRSTGGLILDDLDLWMSSVLGMGIMPDRLVEVEGSRIYTGLSNLLDGEDTALDGDSTGETGFLIGGSTDLVATDMALGGYGEFYDQRIFETIEIPGPGPDPLVTGEGAAEGTWSEYADTDGDGTYDSRHTMYRSEEGWTDSTQTGFTLAGGWTPDGVSQVGLGLGYFKDKVELTPSQLNYSTEVSDSNLVEGIETYTLSEDSEGSELREGGGFGAALSGSFRMAEGVTGGAMFTFISHSVSLENTMAASGSWDSLPSEPEVYDQMTASQSWSYGADLGGSTFGGGAEIRWDLDDTWKMDIVGGYRTMGLDGTSDDYSMSMDTLYQESFGSLLQTTQVDGSSTGSVEVDNSETTARGGLRISASPTDRLDLALGGFFSSHTTSDESIVASSTEIVETFDDGDQEAADPDDYTATSTMSTTEMEKTTLETTGIHFPAAVEFAVLPRLRARLGASPGFVWEKETESTSLLSASPVQTHIVYGDGTEQEFTEDPWVTSDGTLVTTEDSRTEIPFHYGLGFRAAENLTVDLMGISDRMNQWRVSATLLF